MTGISLRPVHDTCMLIIMILHPQMRNDVSPLLLGIRLSIMATPYVYLCHIFHNQADTCRHASSVSDHLPFRTSMYCSLPIPNHA